MISSFVECFLTWQGLPFLYGKLQLSSFKGWRDLKSSVCFDFGFKMLHTISPVYRTRLVLVESLDPVSISNFTGNKDFLSPSLTLSHSFQQRKLVPTIMSFVLLPWQPLSGTPNGYHGNEAMPC